MFPCHVGERLLKLSKICPASFMSGCVNVFFQKKKNGPSKLKTLQFGQFEALKRPKHPNQTLQISREPRNKSRLNQVCLKSRRSTTHHFTQTRNLSEPVPVEPSRREERRKPTVPILPVVPAFGLASGTPIPGGPGPMKGPTSGNASTNEHPKSQMYRSPQILYIYIL